MAFPPIAVNPFNVDAFKTEMVGGGVRPNQFTVTIGFPTFLGPIGVAAGISAQYLVSATSMPASSIGVAATMYRGRAVNFAGDRTYSPWSMTVLNDSTMAVRNAFEVWMNNMDDRQNKSGFVAPFDYTGTIYVSQLDRNNTLIKQVRLNAAFPVNLSELSLDYNANDQIQQYSVELVYQDYDTIQLPVAPETFVAPNLL